MRTLWKNWRNQTGILQKLKTAFEQHDDVLIDKFERNYRKNSRKVNARLWLLAIEYRYFHLVSRLLDRDPAYLQLETTWLLLMSQPKFEILQLLVESNAIDCKREKSLEFCNDYKLAKYLVLYGFPFTENTSKKSVLKSTELNEIKSLLNQSQGEKINQRRLILQELMSETFDYIKNRPTIIAQDQPVTLYFFLANFIFLKKKMEADLNNFFPSVIQMVIIIYMANEVMFPVKDLYADFNHYKSKLAWQNTVSHLKFGSDFLFLFVTEYSCLTKRVSLYTQKFSPPSILNQITRSAAFSLHYAHTLKFLI